MIAIMPEAHAAMLAHARADAPREACGVLLGRDGMVKEAVPVANRAADPLHTFRLDERQYVAALYDGEQRGLGLIGFYHSHPQGLAIPSQTDIAQSHYPDALHVIVGLVGDSLLTVWRLRHGAAEQVDWVMGSAPPELRESRMQTTAIVISAVVAFIILIVLSVALLPPAPRLPMP
ncbi:MAG: M67 family metallopeptidase [Chloroflexota bacterium]|nr:M67 family metallopeptidase [Chloroflexota bacterium]